MPASLSNNAAAQVLNNFIQMTKDASSGTSRIVMQGNEQMGPVRAFFSGKAERQETIDKFQRALTVTYGQQMADMAGARLDSLRSSGKALTAGMVRSVMTDIVQAKAALPNANAANATAILNSPAGKQMADDAFATTGLPEGEKENFIEALKASTTGFAKASDTKMVMSQDIKAHISSIADTCKGAYAAMMESKGYGSYADVTTRVPNQNRADLAILIATTNGKASSQPSMALILEKLDTMREAQPHGALTPQTIWSSCMGEKEMPEGFGTPLAQLGGKLEDAIRDDIAQRCGDRFGPNNMKALMSLVIGVKYDIATALVKTPGPVTKDSCFSLPKLCSSKINSTVDQAVEELAMDIGRMGAGDGGTHSHFTFSGAGGRTSIDVSDRSSMQGDDLAAYDRGKPSSKTTAIKEQVTQLCGTGKQATVVLHALSQAGLFPVRGLSTLTGAGKNEHCAMNIDMSAQDNGDIRMTYTRPEGHGLLGGYQFDVHPDGSTTLNELNLHT